MKRLRHILGLGLLLAVMVRCGNSPDSTALTGTTSQSGTAAFNALKEIDSLMWKQPDSALTVMLKFAASAEADSLNEFDGHYCQMLISELLYKNDYGQSNREELLKAVGYFDSIVAADGYKMDSRRGAPRASAKNVQNIAFLDARVHYINGVGFYEKGDVVNACAEYLRTLEVMEAHFEEKELVGHKARFMSLTYGSLGEMFNEQLLAEPAITCYKQALFYCKREPTSIYGIPVFIYNIGIQFDVSNQKDSAAFYYDKALANMPDYNNIHYRDIITSKSMLAFELGSCLDSVIKDLKYVISLTSDDIERTYRFLSLGEILFASNLYDSSQLYLETVFEQQVDIPSRILAAENLRSIYQIKGDSIMAQKYASFLAGFTMSEMEKKKNVSKIIEMFKSYLTQKQEKHIEEEREKSIMRVIKIIVPIVVVALSIVVVEKLRSKKLLRDKDKRHTESIEAERQIHRMEQAAMSGRLKRSNQEVRELKSQIKQLDDLATKTETATSFNEEPICRLIMERVHKGQFKSKMNCDFYKSYALDKQQLLDLRVAADRHFSQFTLRLRKAYPKLTSIDIDYCCLYLLNLTYADISALMQRAYNTVVERDSKIHKIIGGENPLTIILMDIAQNSSSN